MVESVFTFTIGNGYAWITFVAESLQPLLLVATALTVYEPEIRYICAPGSCCVEVLPFPKFQLHRNEEVSGVNTCPLNVIVAGMQTPSFDAISISGLATIFIGIGAVAVSVQPSLVVTFNLTL